MKLPVKRVTCAVIMEGGKVFAARRGKQAKHPFKWEFPGGKVEAGESDEACLHRELNEELGMQVEIMQKLPVFEHAYPDFHIRLVPFVCRPTGSGHTPGEHDLTEWFAPEYLPGLDWAEADVPVMQFVLKHFF